LGSDADVIANCNIEAERVIMGSPAIDLKNFFRSSIIFSKLPDIYRGHNQLQKEVDTLKKEINKAQSE
jgi:UDP-3-O-[3-hydroxymyristoyl] glucosamine N-acyltransferase